MFAVLTYELLINILFSAVKRSIGFTIGFHNHGEGPYKGLLLVESATSALRHYANQTACPL